jgi:putative phosphoesterase
VLGRCKQHLAACALASENHQDMKVAVISDIHGNVAALQAVLSSIEKHRLDLVVNLGDALSGPLFPVESADLLMAKDILSIRGNHERQLLTLPQDRMNASDRYTATRLLPVHFDWLRKLPTTLQIKDDILLVHGTPTDDMAYFLETVDEKGARQASSVEIESRACTAHQSLILCGHTHVQRSYRLSAHRLIVNPGSVGLPAYEDDLPFPHKMESLSPHARYAVAEKRNGQWTCLMHQVDYDWEGAVVAAEEHGRRDWAHALRTGTAR